MCHCVVVHVFTIVSKYCLITTASYDRRSEYYSHCACCGVTLMCEMKYLSYHLLCSVLLFPN